MGAPTSKRGAEHKHAESRGRGALTSDTNQHESDDSSVALAADGLARIKADRKSVAPPQVLALQTLAGNRAVTRLTGLTGLAIQRHTIDGAPPRPAEDEELQERAVQTLRLQPAWGAAPTAAPLPLQRWDKGVVSKGIAPGDLKLGKARPPEPKWETKSPSVKAKSKFDLGSKRVALGKVRLSKKEIAADGASTVKASVAGPRQAVLWSLLGPPGMSVDAKTGVVTAGVDTGGRDFVDVTVVANDVAVPSVSAQAAFRLWSAPAWQAKVDLNVLLKVSKLVKKGVSTSANGKFDATYIPKAKKLLVEVPVDFQFPDNPITRGMSKAKIAARRKLLNQYRKDFTTNVQNVWGNQYVFDMMREPKSMWGVLGPVSVNVKVRETSKAKSYFHVIYHSKTEGRAGVGRPDVDLYKGDLAPVEAFTKSTRKNELLQLKNISPAVRVEPDGSIGRDSLKSLEFLGTYVKRLRQPPVKFKLTGKGFGSRDSLKRAEVVKKALQQFGVAAPHTLDTASAASLLDRKVYIEPAIDEGFVNMQDVSAHEFGHMIGLPDEYPEDARVVGDKLRTYDRILAAFGQEYADTVGKVTDSTASIMHGGSQVRVQHYVHFWDTLIMTSNLNAKAPKTKFGDPDWKIRG